MQEFRRKKMNIMTLQDQIYTYIHTYIYMQMHTQIHAHMYAPT